MYFTSGAKVRTMRLRSWGSFVSRYFFHSASVSSWEMRFRLLGSSFIGSSGSFGRGGSGLDRPAGAELLASLAEFPFPPAAPAVGGSAYRRRWSRVGSSGFGTHTRPYPDERRPSRRPFLKERPD